CDAGHAASCATLAAMYRDGINVAKDWTKAAGLAQAACDKDVLAACRLIGNAKLGGQGVPKDLKDGIAVLDRVCLAGDTRGCVDLGIARLADKKLAGDAQYAFRRACYGGEFDGCAWLGSLYVEGKGGMRVSPALGIKFLDKGCREGSMRACTMQADVLTAGTGVPKDVAKAKALYAKACGAGEAVACKKK
ncbi:MAG: sel1 repeat family protein, partial [Deltaproteobacteria bacterium]|nr:sel1 repeat family protein [Deltaproteobacteria bacterium]